MLNTTLLTIILLLVAMEFALSMVLLIHRRKKTGPNIDELIHSDLAGAIKLVVDSHNEMMIEVKRVQASNAIILAALPDMTKHNRDIRLQFLFNTKKRRGREIAYESIAQLAGLLNQFKRDESGPQVPKEARPE